MSDSAGKKTPKSLADVSHLFFSKTDPAEDDDTRVAVTAPDEAVAPVANDVSATGDTPVVGDASQVGDASVVSDAPVVGDAPVVVGATAGRRTRLFVVTGGDGAPGKSTVAVSLAHAFQTTGSVAVLDADPQVPNARFYMGAPSWHYLTPLTGDVRAPSIRLESGLVSVDCTGTRRADEIIASGREIYFDVEGEPRGAVSSAIIDVPSDRLEWVAPVADRVGLFVVVARPGWEGFEEAFGVLKRLSADLGVRSAGLIVNHVPDNDYAAKFYAKTRAAAERLLSMEMHFLGGMVREESLASQQRERGAVIRNRPDTVFALMLREAASKALGSEEAGQTCTPSSDHTNGATP